MLQKRDNVTNHVDHELAKELTKDSQATNPVRKEDSQATKMDKIINKFKKDILERQQIVHAEVYDKYMRG